MKYAYQVLLRGLWVVVFGLSLVGFVATILGCAAGTVHVAPVASTSFAEMMIAEEMANARRAAHFMRQTV